VGLGLKSLHIIAELAETRPISNRNANAIADLRLFRDRNLSYMCSRAGIRLSLSGRFTIARRAAVVRLTRDR
jgi:hypothetical protein